MLLEIYMTLNFLITGYYVGKYCNHEQSLVFCVLNAVILMFFGCFAALFVWLSKSLGFMKTVLNWGVCSTFLFSKAIKDQLTGDRETNEIKIEETK